MRVLKRGMRGTDVMDLQAVLLKLNYTPGPIDGIFGVLTEQAVKDFQRDNGLVVDGIVGPITYKALQEHIPGDGEYIVKAGDTLYTIAKLYHTTVQRLLELNPGINPNNLQIGQRIKVPTVTKIRSVGGWIPYWTQSVSFRVYETNSDVFEIMSPFWYTLNNFGGLVNFPNSEEREMIRYALSRGEKIIPLISNDYNGKIVSEILNNLSKRQTHITSIVNKVVQMGYNGIEIDYENLYPQDKNAFSSFIADLADALHARGKQLIVTVHAKTNDLGATTGAQAHDYEALGKVADGVRIMAYDYHWAGGTAGPIAPFEWVEKVLAYAVSKMSPCKIVLGMPTYGYDWDETSQGRAKSVSYFDAMNLARTYEARIHVDNENGPHFHYQKEGRDHEVWFSDAGSFARLLDLVNQYQIQGIAIWYLGGEEPEIYDAIRLKLLLDSPLETVETESENLTGEVE